MLVAAKDNSCEDRIEQQSHFLNYDVLFRSNEAVAIKHSGRREQWGSFLAILLKYVLAKPRGGTEINFVVDTMRSLYM